MSGGNAELRIIAPNLPAFVVTRLRREGETVIRIPVTYMKIGMSSETIFPQGFLYVGRDSISFEPTMNPKAKKKGISLARPGVTAETTGAPGLRLRAGGKTWSFRPLLAVNPQMGLPIPSSGAMKEAWIAAVDLAARLFGDFDQALRAFDDPELLKAMPARRAADASTAAGEDSP